MSVTIRLKRDHTQTRTVERVVGSFGLPSHLYWWNTAEELQVGEVRLCEYRHEHWEEVPAAKDVSAKCEVAVFGLGGFIGFQYVKKDRVSGRTDAIMPVTAERGYSIRKATLGDLMTDSLSHQRTVFIIEKEQ